MYGFMNVVLIALPKLEKVISLSCAVFCLGLVIGFLQTPVHAAGSETKLAYNQKIVKQTSPKQQAAHEYDQALSYLEQGRVAECLDMLKQSLETLPEHDDARLTLLSLLIENQKHDEALQILETGMLVSATPAIYAETLARLQLDAGLLESSRQTLERYKAQGEHASYQGLLAAVLQRLSEHDLASQHFQKAIQTGANLPQYWIGWAVSLQALGQYEQAKKAYQAVQNAQLSPELSVFVTERVKQLP